jgi:AcrR family transcriptional regulator
MPTAKLSPAPVPPAEAGTIPTQQRILDAAEAVFAKQGYYGATIRDITQAAGVQLSLSRYHFGTKDHLFRCVLERRADATCLQLTTSLELALAASPPEHRLEAIVEAMVAVPVEQLAQGDAGWRNYLQLLAQLAQVHDRPDLLQPFRDRYVDTVARYRAALRQALPGAPAATIDWGLHFLETLVGHAMHNLALTRWLGGDENPPIDWAELRRQMVAHVVGGIRAQLALPAVAAASSQAGRRRSARSAQ